MFMNQLSPSIFQIKHGRVFEFLNQCIPVLVGIFIFFNPYPNVTAIQEISFYGSILILIVLLFFNKTIFTLRTPLSIIFALFVLWSFVGLFFALNTGNSIHDFYAHLIKYLSVFFLIFNFFNTEKRILILIWIIIVSTAIYSAGMLVGFYIQSGYDILVKLGLYTDGQYEIPSNIIGISTLFGLLLSLYQITKEDILYRKIILIICLCAMAIATLATQTMGTILAMIGSLIISFLKNKKALLFFLFFLVLVTLVMPVRYKLTPSAFMDKIRTDPRINVWYNFLEIVKDYPITGIGFGMQTYYDENLLNKYNERVPAKYKQAIPMKAPHNIVIDIAVRVGLVGLVLFFYIIFVFARISWQIIKFGKDDFIRHWGVCFLAAFVAVFIQGQFENIWWGPPVIILFTILAMTSILWHLNIKVDVP